MRREQLRDTRTSLPHRSSAGHGTLARWVPRAAYRTILSYWERTTIYHQAERHKGCSPVPSVSHVLMTAPGMGSPPVVSTRPSTNIYSPVPSDAIDSPNRTAGAVNVKRVRIPRPRMQEEENGEGILRTVWCILGEKRAQKAALCRVPNSGVVEPVDEGRHTKRIREYI